MNGPSTPIALRKLTAGDDPELQPRRRYEGSIVDGVKPGRPMLIVYGQGKCIITTPVRRILQAVGDPRQFVATDNSVYELRVRARSG